MMCKPLLFHMISFCLHSKTREVGRKLCLSLKYSYPVCTSIANIDKKIGQSCMIHVYLFQRRATTHNILLTPIHVVDTLITELFCLCDQAQLNGSF